MLALVLVCRIVFSGMGAVAVLLNEAVLRVVVHQLFTDFGVSFEAKSIVLLVISFVSKLSHF